MIGVVMLNLSLYAAATQIETRVTTKNQCLISGYKISYVTGNLIPIS
jgi:hypothetical protein